MEQNLTTKDDILNKLRAYVDTPDDDNIRIKNKIYNMLLNCPELLYALHNKELENELFNEDGSINYEGEWDRYFGETSLIRPYVFIPETQTEVKHFLCYQVSVKEQPRYNKFEKYLLVTFTIFVHGKDAIDEETGIPRHDLIGSIIRERMAWSGITTGAAVPVQNTEATTDTNYITKTMVYQTVLPNDICTTIGKDTFYTDKGKKF